MGSPELPDNPFLRERREREAAARAYRRRIFGENLTGVMAERGIASGAVADALGVSRRTVDGWRSGALPRERLLDLARLLRVPRTRLTEPARRGRRHPLNHSPDDVAPHDRPPFTRGYRVRVTEPQEWSIDDLARTRGIKPEDAIRWFVGLGMLYEAMRRTAQHMDRDGFGCAYRLERLLEETELHGFRIEAIGDLERIYP